LSVYGLIIEEGTPFYLERDSLDIPSADDECRMYENACELLCNAGYGHYEISNYAKPGYECRHNLKYWTAKEYIGFGLSAFSYFNGIRYGNSKNWQEYNDTPSVIPTYKESIDLDAQKYEYVMLGLRLSRGISFSEYEKRFGEDFRVGRQPLLDRLHKVGYVNITDDGMNLTDRGFYLSNSILTELL
jgi:oxygen-independent coproporphyrinogen-3 oxidase